MKSKFFNHKIHHYGKTNVIKNYFYNLSKKEYDKNHIASNKSIIIKNLFQSNIIKNILKKTNIAIVDLGAGYCDLERELKKLIKPYQDISVIAIDNCDNILEKAKKNIKNPPFKVKLLVTDALCTGLINNCSNLTFLINVLPYIKDARKILDESYRITTNRGLIVIVYPLKDKFGFWVYHFGRIDIYFHEKLEDYIDYNKFEILKNRLIYINPIEDVKIIKLEIAKLIILKVIK